MANHSIHRQLALTSKQHWFFIVANCAFVYEIALGFCYVYSLKPLAPYGKKEQARRDTLNDVQLYLVDEFVKEYQEGQLSWHEALNGIAASTKYIRA